MLQQYDIDERKKRLTWLTYMAAVLSGFTTWLGLYFTLTFADEFLRISTSTMLTLFSIALPIVMWPGYYTLYPQSDEEGRKRIMKDIGLLALMLVCISTFFSVTGIGGPVAVERHFHSTVEDADVTLSELYDIRRQEQTLLKPTLVRMEDMFRQMAMHEKKTGDISGHKREGPVYRQLIAISDGFGNLVKSIDDQAESLTAKHIEANKIIKELRGIANSRSLNLKTKEAKFIEKLNELNTVFSDIHHTTVVSSIASITEKMGSLIVVAGPKGKGRVAKDQKEARSKLKGSLDTAVQLVAQEVKKLKEKDVELKPFTTMHIVLAIFVYFLYILPLWAIALGIDLAPLLAIRMLTRMTDEIKRQQLVIEEGAEVINITDHTVTETSE